MGSGKFWRRRLRSLISCGFLFLPLALVTSASAQPAADGMATLQAFLDGVQTLTADFKQELWTADQRPLQTDTGSLSMKRPNRFRWTYEEPAELTIVADGERLWIYDVELAQVTVTPLDDTIGASPAMLLSGDGNVREEFAMKLSTEWLTNLPAVLRRLPDDRYRIYLLLEGGNEERLVIDVLVRDGRPVEPDDTADESAIPIAPAEMPAGQPGPGQPELLPQPPTLGVPPVNQPAEPIGGHLLTPQMGSFIPAGSSNSGGLYFGAAAAMAAVVASRQSSSRWTEEVDQAAETIGRTRAPLGWRWWRLASDRSESAGT